MKSFHMFFKVFYDACRCSPSLTTLPTESELTSSTWTGSLERLGVPPPHPPQTSLRPSEEALTRIPFFPPKTALCQNEKRSFPLKPPGLHPEAHTHSNEKKDIFEKDSHNVTRTTTYFYMKCSQKELTLRVS